MAKLSDLWYHPINPKIIEELMVSVDVGKGKDYTSKMVFEVVNGNGCKRFIPIGIPNNVYRFKSYHPHK